MTDYPAATRAETVDVLFGRRVADPYRWLEDLGAVESLAWQHAQDARYDAFRQRFPRRGDVCARLTELAGVEMVSAPAWRGDRQFVLRRPSGREHGVLWVVEPDGAERVLIDPMEIDPSGHTTLDIWQPSREGDLVAYQLSVGGTEESELRIMSVGSGEVVDGPIDRTRYSMLAWLPEGRAFYYVRKAAAETVPEGESSYHRRIYLHTVGSPVRDDVLVFGAEMPKESSYAIALSRDCRWLVVSAAQGAAHENRVWLADLHRTGIRTPDLREVDTGGNGVSSLSVGRNGRGYAFTTVAAPRGRLCVFDPVKPDREHWRDLVPERPDAILRSWSILDGSALETPLLLVGWTRNTISEVTIHDLRSGAHLGDLELPGTGAVSAMGIRPEGGHEVWFTYTDHVTPPAVYHWDAVGSTLRLWASAGTAEVPDATVSRETYLSGDGTEVDMLVVEPASDLPRTPRPALMRGYGGFGVASGPHYSPEALAWVRAGGVYVDVQVRGGGEKGEAWHRDGMGARKQNTFDDFHAAADRLVKGGWTTPEQLGIIGSSNGGLLVGAALVQRPDLYASVVCSAPLLDMVRYEQSGLGRLWTSEYGTAADPEQLDWLLSYSPYHHVRAGTRYPAVLFTVFDNDTRVDPAHARKMCAALQHSTTGDRPILLRRDGLGHGGRSLSSAVGLLADSLIFSAVHTGLDVNGLC